jgi:hypothetical protein
MIRRLTAPATQLSSFRYYDLLVHALVVILLICNLVGQKICVIPFIHLFGHVPRVSGAQLLFPITYIFGDIFIAGLRLWRVASCDLDRFLPISF